MSVQAGVHLVAGKKSGGWIAGTARVSAPSPKRTQARLDNAKAGSAHVAIVSALFLVLFAATLLVGGHAAIDPLVQAVMQPQDTRSAGAIVVTMPDGVFCRHVSFDNVTAQETEGPIERCHTDFEMERQLSLPKRGFTWRSN